jgi:putative phosphoribosyl transferase
VGELDEEVLGLNEQAMRAMRCQVTLEIVPGATHLFEEPGTLALAACLAGNWFLAHLAPGGRPGV